MPKLSKSSKKWIFLIIILVILAVLAFSYSKTPALFPDFLKTLINYQGTVVDKAQKAGYKIAWTGDPKDTTGRTLLAKGQRSEELFSENLGGTEIKEEGLDLIENSQGIGVFEKWEKIPGSKDYYMILANPLSKSIETKQSPVRIVIDPTENSTNAAVVKPTMLAVENLDYGFKNKTVAFARDYGRFSDISDSVLNKIIKPGDVIEVYTILLNEEQRKAQKRSVLMDELERPYAMTVLIRRFGGLDQLMLELK